MEACIMICKMNKKPENRGKVLFINAVNDVERKNAQSYLTDEHIKHIANAYENYADEDGFASVVTIEDIAKNDYSLSIPLYVKSNADAVESDSRSFDEIYSSWEHKSNTMHESYEELNRLLQEVSNVES